MDFSIRLARAAAVMTWVSLVVGVVAATLIDQLGAMPGVHIHLYAVYAWSGFGAAVATLLTALPTLAMKSHFVLKNITAFRAFLLISDTIWATATVSVTGGVRGPFWICFLGVVLSVVCVGSAGWSCVCRCLSSRARDTRASWWPTRAGRRAVTVKGYSDVVDCPGQRPIALAPRAPRARSADVTSDAGGREPSAVPSAEAQPGTWRP